MLPLLVSLEKFPQIDMHLTFLTSSSFNNFFHTELSHSPDMYFGIWHGVKVSLPCLLHTHV